MWHVICYDIQESRRRNRLAKLLEDWGDRVQFSVFEASLTRDELPTLIAGIEELIDPTTDSVYIYPICERCRTGTVVCGQGTAFDDDIVWIV